ncbi:hypothetical protein RSAG8_01823, partial [Rhizoctonia solani AG-8 WAC10335]
MWGNNHWVSLLARNLSIYDEWTAVYIRPDYGFDSTAYYIRYMTEESGSVVNTARFTLSQMTGRTLANCLMNSQIPTSSLMDLVDLSLLLMPTRTLAPLLLKPPQARILLRDKLRDLAKLETPPPRLALTPLPQVHTVLPMKQIKVLHRLAGQLDLLEPHRPHRWMIRRTRSRPQLVTGLAQ